jgi:hypothetical protein
VSIPHSFVRDKGAAPLGRLLQVYLIEPLLGEYRLALLVVAFNDQVKFVHGLA